jgi:hypothetical protein
MIPIEQASDGTLVFLKCGCAGFRARIHPSGGAALVLIKQICRQHAGYDQPLTDGTLVRSVPRGEMVSPFVRVPVAPDSLPAR